MTLVLVHLAATSDTEGTSLANDLSLFDAFLSLHVIDERTKLILLSYLDNVQIRTRNWELSLFH